ncbi:Fido domain-containing protein [Armadillidium vulgare]|nr:Fido domain-containing protein [Armadillidium vulgare]
MPINEFLSSWIITTTPVNFIKNSDFLDISRKYSLYFICAAWILHKFVSLHPFADGNGRMGRLLASYCLYLPKRESYNTKCRYFAYKVECVLNTNIKINTLINIINIVIAKYQNEFYFFIK